MKQHEIYQDNAPAIFQKKNYSKPVLTVLGKVSDSTAGGTTGSTESSPSNKFKQLPPTPTPTPRP